MKKFITILFLCFGFIANSQLTSFVVRNDTLFSFNPSTGVYTQLTKLVATQDGQAGKFLSTNGSTYLWTIPDTLIYSTKRHRQKGLDSIGAVKSTYYFGTDAGANDSYVITASPVPASYTVGMKVTFRANTANTTGCTINVNGLGVVNIVKRVSTTLATGDILAQMFCDLVYNGTAFVILNPVVN